MKKLFQILVFLMIPLGISAQNSLSIKVLNPPKTIKPGEHFTLFIEVRSSKPLDKKVEITLMLPDNWNVLMSKKPNKFKDEQIVKFIYTISSSNFTPKGIHNVGVSVSGEGYDSEIENQSIEVKQVRNLEILTLNTPEFVREGDTLTTEFIIQNAGNNAERVALKTLHGKIELPKSDTIKIDTLKLISTKKKKNVKVELINNENRVDSVTIAPNESMRIKVVQIIPVSEQNSWNTSSDLQLMMKDSVNPISSIVSVPVFSNKNKKSDPYLRFPIEMGVWYNNFMIGDKRVSGYQYDVRGRGDLDFDKKHHLEFIIHGPNQFNVPAVGSYDQYFLEYTYKKQYRITVGDYTLRMNNLMELGRFGRGARFDQSFKKIDFSVFYTNPRFYPNQRDTYGGVFTVKPSDKFNISFNILSKTLLDNQLRAFDAQFYGISTKVQSKSFNLETEFSSSLADGKTDFGFFNRLNWRIGRFQLGNDLIYTGKNFYGFYKDSYLLINSINYYLSRKVSMNLVNNITRLNPSLDLTVFNSSPYSQSNMLSLNYQMSKTNRMFVSYEMREREDKSISKSFHFTEQYGRVAYYINAPKFTLWFDNKYGTSQNLLVKSDSSVNQRLIQTLVLPQVRVLPWLWIGGYFDYQRTSKFSNDNSIRNFYYYGGSTKVIFSKVFMASVMFRNNYAPDELVERRTFLDVNANLHLGNHDFTLTGGQAFIPNAQQSNQNTQFFTLKYGYRFNAPIARNKKLSSIKGQILGLNSSINPKGIIVQMGDKRFMTDANGNFQFNDLMPDRYYINLVRASMGIGVISATKTPLEVNVKADTTYKIEIPLTKTGAILGRINFQKSESIGALDISKQKPIVLVKLFNEKESLLTQVNSKDEFSFKEIKPGKWQVLAWIPGKLDQFIIQNTDQAIDLVAGQMKDIAISIVPNERKVIFSNKTHVLSTKK